MARAVMKRIAILTGGGDVPGLNTVIKSVVYRSSEVGWVSLGIRRGWQGLTHMDPAQEDGGGFLLDCPRALADMLMEAGQPTAALAEYEASFARDPNRFRGIYGAACAADAAGDRDKTGLYAHKLLELAKTADTDRPELSWARSHS